MLNFLAIYFLFLRHPVSVNICCFPLITKKLFVQEHIRSKYLQSFLQCIGQGIKNNNPLVRNAALYTLGQFSEFIQPEISNYAPEILPILLEHLDLSFASIQPGGKDPPGVARVFYALETFCENLDEKLEPHLPAIMQVLDIVLGHILYFE